MQGMAIWATRDQHHSTIATSTSTINIDDDNDEDGNEEMAQHVATEEYDAVSALHRLARKSKAILQAKSCPDG